MPASYEARRYGVHSAMPTGRALRLCPQAAVLPVRMERYVDISRQIHAVFVRYTPLIEPISLDEAFLDVTASTNLFGSAETIGRQIKEEIKTQTHLTASVGVAPNKFLAKLASDLDKPDGFVVITEANKQTLLDPLSVGRIWGVGDVTEQALRKAGIETIGTLRQYPVETLRTIVGNGAEGLLALAHGNDDRAVQPDRQRKNLSSEQTFTTRCRRYGGALERPARTGRRSRATPAAQPTQSTNNHTQAALRRFPHRDATRNCSARRRI